MGWGAVSDSLTITVVLEFLTERFDRGYSYSTINSASSFLSSILASINGLSVGSDPLTRCLHWLSQFTAVYGDLGCEHCLISFIRSKGDNEVLSLFNLTLKFVMLLALLNGQRTQTLSFFNLDNMHVYEDRIVFCVRNLVKQSRPSYHLKPVTVLACAQL